MLVHRPAEYGLSWSRSENSLVRVWKRTPTKRYA